MGRDDEKWVSKAQEGSKKAFDRLVRKYAELIFHLLYDLTGNYEDAQDLTQETFLRAFINIRKYRGDAKFSTWLYRVAYNLGIDFMRRRKRGLEVDWESQERKGVLERFDPSDGKGYTGEREAIEGALKTLTQSQRMAVVLHYYHGFQMREIGEVLGCSEGTVRVHLFRALRRLRKQLKDYSPEV
jgi:RNA polymerase sigma-70 factor (ECF subfamily)